MNAHTHTHAFGLLVLLSPFCLGLQLFVSFPYLPVLDATAIEGKNALSYSYLLCLAVVWHRVENKCLVK